MKEPVDHILRPKLPWRTDDAAITECGYDASKVKTLSRDDFFSRIKNLGIQRVTMLTCMTCSSTAQRWPTWEEDPRKALEREIAWEGGSWRFEDRGSCLKIELLAIAALINAFPQEFADRINEIAARQEWLQKKDARSKKPKISRQQTFWRPL
jgi:hypothetical protein